MLSSANETLGAVPCILHYQGRDNAKSHEFIDSWRTCMPPAASCRTMFWTDELLNRLVATKYPQFWKMYSAAPVNVLRWDMSRYMVLHAYGGIYFDNDYECVAPQGKFELGSGAASRLPLHVVESPYKFNEILQNSLMASTRGHPIWMDIMQDVLFVADHGWCINKDGNYDILASAGPTRLEKWVTHPKYAGCTNLLPFESYFNGQDAHAKKAIHHNRNSWVDDISLVPNTFGNMSRRCGCQQQDCWTHGRLCRSET